VNFRIQGEKNADSAVPALSMMALHIRPSTMYCLVPVLVVSTCTMAHRRIYELLGFFSASTISSPTTMLSVAAIFGMTVNQKLLRIPLATTPDK
jgi:hypothetical protein